MKNRVFLLFAVYGILVPAKLLLSQSSRSSDSLVTTPVNAEKVIGRLTSSYDRTEAAMAKSCARWVKRMKQAEARLMSKTGKPDSLVLAQYDTLLSRLSRPAIPGNISRLSDYIPSLDSLQTSLKFLGTGQSLSGQLSALQGRVKQLSDVRQFLEQRQQLWKSQLSQLGMLKELKAINQEVYYYRQQLAEYKTLLSDPDKLARKLIALARSNQQFNAFFTSNSVLAQLFPAPAGMGTAQALQGLQTRTGVQQQIGRQIGVGGGNPQQYMEQQLSQAQSQLNALKDKVNQFGGGSSDLDMPDFKPNSQRTKTFWKRLEYGLNIQSQRPNGLLPVTSDIALTAGYRLSDKMVVGIGSSYKIGWGKDISHIRISGQGMSLRSYMDIKLKGSFWISGGYEYNYQQEFNKLDILRDLGAWQKSGLVGLTKKYRIGKRNGNFQLLWDFLSYGQVPKTQPLKFRIGYTF